MEARFIYRSDARSYGAFSGEAGGGADKVIVYVNGVLCAMDREARITIPVSRWKLAEIGLACFWAALRGESKVAVLPSSETAPLPAPAIEEAPPPATDSLPAPMQESNEGQWERLMREMRDLSR